MNASTLRRAAHPGLTATLLIACGVLAILAWALLRPTTRTSRPTPLPEVAPAAAVPLELPPPRVATPPVAQAAPVVPVAPTPPVAPARESSTREPVRPDLLSEEDQQIRAEERQMLHERWKRQEPNPAAEDVMYGAMKSKLLERNLDAAALSDLDCKRALCRFELSTRGEAGLTPVSEVHELIRAVRDLGESWVQATEPRPGFWRVEVFAPTENHTLTGPAIE